MEFAARVEVTTWPGNFALHCAPNVPQTANKSYGSGVENVNFSGPDLGVAFWMQKRVTPKCNKEFPPGPRFGTHGHKRRKVQDDKDTVIIRLVLTRWASMFVSGACLQK